MTRVREGVKADQVGAEEPLEDLIAPREGAEDVARRKRDVEKEADLRPRNQPPQEPRNEHQLVVVNPNQVARLVALGDGGGELLVHLTIGVPVVGVRRDEIELVVKERPENAVREAVVVALHFVGREVHRNRARLGELRVHLGPRFGRDLRHVARETDPQPARALMRPAQPRREPARARRDLGPTCIALHREGEPVGNDEKSLHQYLAVAGIAREAR